MSRCLNFTFRSKDKDFPDANEAPIDLLPNELLMEIFKMLPIEELVTCENVCRRWRKVATDPAIWRAMTVVCSSQLGEIPENRVAIIKSHRKCLRCIKLQYILKYPLVKSLTQHCINLISLELIMCRLEKEFEEDIKKYTELKKLNLKNSLLKSESDLVIQFDQFKKLNYLGLSEFGLSAANCESLLKCSNLNHIIIDKIRGLTLEFIKLLIRTKQSTLASLSIYGGNAVDDEVLFMLAKCPRLEDLAVIRCENLTDKSLVAIETFPIISSLRLWNNNTFSEAVLMNTLKSPVLIKLKRLSLSRVHNVSSRVVEMIINCYVNLRFLAVYQCPLIVSNDYEKQLKAKFKDIELVIY